MISPTEVLDLLSFKFTASCKIIFVAICMVFVLNFSSVS